MLCYKTSIQIIRAEETKVDINKSTVHETAVRISYSEMLASAPQPVQNFSFVSVNATEVSVDWDALAFSFDDYTLKAYNKTAGTLEQENTGITGTSYTFTGLTTGDVYDFWIVSVRDGIESEKSAIIEVIPSVIPSAPSGLSIVSKSADSLTLGWDSASDTVTGYDLYIDGVKDNSNPVTANQYQFNGLSSLTEYNLEIKALNNRASSPKSSIIGKTSILDRPLMFVSSVLDWIGTVDRETGELLHTTSDFPWARPETLVIDPKNSRLYAGSYEGHVIRYDIESDGSLTRIWTSRHNTNGVQHISVDLEGRVFACIGNDAHRIDQDDGSLVWVRGDITLQRIFPSPNGHYGVGYRNMYFIDIADGSTITETSYSSRTGRDYESDKNGMLHYAAPDYGTYMVDPTTGNTIQSVGLPYWLAEAEKVYAGNNHILTNAGSYDGMMQVRKISDYSKVGSNRDAYNGYRSNYPNDIDKDDNIYFKKSDRSTYVKQDVDGNEIWSTTEFDDVRGAAVWPGAPYPWF